MGMANDISPPKWRKALFSAALGAVFGVIGVTAVLTLRDSGALGTIGRSEEIAGLVGVVYLLNALAVGFGLASPKAGARYLNVEDESELLEQRRMLLMSAVAMAAIGFALAIVAVAGPAGIVAPAPALGAALALMVLATALSIALRRQMDELMRSLSRETAALAFYLLALVGGGWALLDHLGFAAGPAPLDWLSLLAGLMLLAAFIAVGRRGMLAPR